MAVALGLGAEGADHLRVAANAALADVQVPAFELQRGVRLHAFNRLVHCVLKEQRDDLGQTADAHCQDHEQGQQTNVLFEYFVVLHLSVPQAICAAVSYWADLAARTVRQVLYAINSMPARKNAPPTARTMKPG